MGQGNLVTFAVVILACACLALPVLWLQTRLARRRAGPKAASPDPVPRPRALDPRIAELERETIRLRGELAAVRETIALHQALRGRYEELIERLSPGLLANAPTKAEPKPEPMKIAAE